MFLKLHSKLLILYLLLCAAVVNGSSNASLSENNNDSKSVATNRNIIVSDHEGEQTKKRLLRGGSYSRGGGSSYHSSSSSYHSSSSSSSGYHSSSSSNNNNRNRNRNKNKSSTRNRNNGWSTASKVLTGLAVGAAGLALMALLFPSLGIGAACGALPCCLAGACCGLFAANAASEIGGSGKSSSSPNNNNNAYAGGYKPGIDDEGGYYNSDYYNSSTPHNNNNNNNGPLPTAYDQNNPNFEQCVQKAKREVEGSSSNVPYVPNSNPYSGAYVTSYIDLTTQKKHQTKLNLIFRPSFQANGFNITGEGEDIDGKTIIEDGHVNYDGTAWWKERAVTGDVGLMVLSRGKFDLTQHTFKGTWLANSMEYGQYLSFHTVNNNNNNNNQQANGNGFAMHDNATMSASSPVAAPSAPMESQVYIPPGVTGNHNYNTNNDYYNNNNKNNTSIPVVAAMASPAPVPNNNYYAKTQHQPVGVPIVAAYPAGQQSHGGAAIPIVAATNVNQ